MRLLTRPPAARLATAPDHGITPRQAAIRLLAEKIASNEGGLDPYCPSDLIVLAHENETVWVNRCASLCGVVLLRVPQVGRGERFRVVLEADVRMALGLDVPEPPLMLDEPLASRGVDATRCSDCGGPLEGWAGEHHSQQCRLVDASGVALDRMLDALPSAQPREAEPVSLGALRDAKAAYDRRYPHGAEPQLVIRTDTPEAS